VHQISWDDASRPCGNDHVTKSRNRKLIRETSSNERLEHKCVDLSDYRRYLNQILYWLLLYEIVHEVGLHKKKEGRKKLNSSTTLLTWRDVPNVRDLKIQDGGGRHLGFRKMSITSNWIELRVFAQNLVRRCITAMRRWHMTKTRNRNFFAWRHCCDK